jgi:hypothetical protein
MIDLGPERLQAFVQKAFGQGATLLDYGDIGSLDKQGIKKFGYGKPVRFKLRLADGTERQAVLSVMKGDKYGHQHMWDRASILLFQYETSERLDRHVKPLSVGYVDGRGELHPMERPSEFFLVTEMLPGHDYYQELARIRQGDFRSKDRKRATEFARWLAGIHAKKKNDPPLYHRRVRDLLGSSECIMGMVDEAYPHPYAPFPDERFRNLEKALIDWRWFLRDKSHRLSQVHGDFHPWNVLVEDHGFHVLDRSRGEWGEPAGDLASMAVNYLLLALLDKGRLEGPFADLWHRFFESYLAESGDTEVLSVIAPFFVFRCLVVASPEWYPDHPEEVRAALLHFMERVLAAERFDFTDTGRYLP